MEKHKYFQYHLYNHRGLSYDAMNKQLFAKKPYPHRINDEYIAAVEWWANHKWKIPNSDWLFKLTGEVKEVLLPASPHKELLLPENLLDQYRNRDNQG